MATCPDCGSDVDTSQQYCSECGTQLNQQKVDATSDGGSAIESDTGSTIIGRSDSSSPRSEESSDTAEALSGALAGLTRDQKIVIGGGALTVISAFLPWASALGFSVSGIDGDGIITLALGIVAAAVVFFEPLDDRNITIAGVSGVLIALIGIISITSVAAIGVYLTVLGGIIIAYPWVSQLVTSYTSGQSS